MILNLATNEANDTFPPFMTAPEVARILKVSVRTIWRWRSGGKLPKSIEIGGAVRWKGDDMRNWMDEGCPSLTT